MEGGSAKRGQTLQVISRYVSRAVGLTDCVGAIDEVPTGGEDRHVDSISGEVAKGKCSLD
jgi:hypothetical protein